MYGINILQPSYTSTAELYIVPGAENEESLRGADGGLNDDFAEVITNGIVIGDAKKNVGTSENIVQYLKVTTPANTNIVRIHCVNPDAGTAKTYVDAVANSAVNNIKDVIPVKSVKVLSLGSVQSEPDRPELVRYIVGIAALAAVVCLFVEIIVLLFMCAFKKPVDDSDDELEYERNYGKYAVISKDDIRVLKDAMTEVAASKVSESKSTHDDEKEEAKAEPEPEEDSDLEDSDAEEIPEESEEEVLVEPEDSDEDEDVLEDEKESVKKTVKVLGRIKK